MQKNEMMTHLQDMIARHRSVFVLGKSYIEELNDNRYFTDEEKQKIKEFLELVVGDVIEHKSILTDILQTVVEGDENKIY